MLLRWLVCRHLRCCLLALCPFACVLAIAPHLLQFKYTHAFYFWHLLTYDELKHIALSNPASRRFACNEMLVLVAQTKKLSTLLAAVHLSQWHELSQILMADA